MDQQIPDEVRALLDRDEIRDALLRYCRGVDRRDLELLRSVYHEDAVHEYGDWSMNAREFAEVIVRTIGEQFSTTTHRLSNERVVLAGDVAQAESYVQAVHLRERDGRRFELVLALRYVDRFERRGGAWRIAQRTTLHDWSRETPLGPEPTDAIKVLRGRRDREDASYHASQQAGDRAGDKKRTDQD